MTNLMTDTGDRLRLAWCGLHPDRTRKLLGQWGSAGAVLRAITKGQIKYGDRVRGAAAVDPQGANRLLSEFEVRAVWGDGAEYPALLADLPDAPDLSRGHHGEAGADVMDGGTAADTTRGGGGDDHLGAGGGPDTMWAGRGSTRSR
jgi:Ca2+-binding RTX toxin-like protein